MQRNRYKMGFAEARGQMTDNAKESLQDGLCGSEGTDDMRSRQIQAAGVYALIAIAEMLKEMLPYFKRELSKFRPVSPEARFKMLCEARDEANKQKISKTKEDKPEGGVKADEESHGRSTTRDG
jgi:hypothetical protein